MDTLLRIDMTYTLDEVHTIIHDYTPDRKWSLDAKKDMSALFREYFAENKVQIIKEIDALICQKIYDVLIANDYIINTNIKEDEVNDEEW